METNTCTANIEDAKLLLTAALFTCAQTRDVELLEVIIRVAKANGLEELL
jgi:hypothetical protein